MEFSYNQPIAKFLNLNTSHKTIRVTCNCFALTTLVIAFVLNSSLLTKNIIKQLKFSRQKITIDSIHYIIFNEL